MGVFRTKDGLVHLRGDLHISDADNLREALIVELTAAPALVLELSEVDSCDAASLQLLCALKKSADICGKMIQITGASAAMVETSAILGFSLHDLTSTPSNHK
jgi:anti-anti-sigma factor